MMLRSHSKGVLILILTTLMSINVAAQSEKILDAAELELAIKKLSVLGSVLYIAAHPDDENTAALAYFESGRMLRTGYCAMNRGSGGQNLLGDEQADLLGIIRTQELLAARRIDGAEQFFTRAIDFGYTKSPDETFKIWGKQEILSDVVWTIRKFRPDVIITRFPDTGEGGHGHHTASAILAEEAFKLAGDPNSFPEQLQYVKPWEPKRLYVNVWPSLVKEKYNNPDNLIQIDLGAYNPLLGKSYTEIAAESRSMHKSQGFGISAIRGSSVNYFYYIEGEKAKNDLFSGIDLTWNRVKGSGEVQNLISEIQKEFNPENPSASLPKLLKLYSELNKLDDNYWVPLKTKEILKIIQSAAGIWIEAFANDYSFSPGDSVKISTGIVNRSDFPLSLKKISTSYLSNPIVLNKSLTNNNFFKTDAEIVLPKNIPITQPFWLVNSHGEGRYDVNDRQLIGRPENDPPLTAEYTLTDGKTDFNLSVPVLYHWTDPVRGEEYRPIEITPPVAINFTDKLYLFPDNKSRTISVNLISNKNGANGKLSLQIPDGWKTEPQEYQYLLNKKGEEKSFTFVVTPPDSQSEVIIKAVATEEGKEISRGMITIDYPHIPIQTVFPPAEVKLIRLNIKKTISSLGYIMGSGDEIPEFLQQLGYRIHLISDEDLDTANLNKYDAIITGVRAYNTRERLAAAQPKLMKYVQDGGTLVVQYITLADLVTENIGPYPITISHDRITVEDTPIKFVNPSDPLLHYPNNITENDFKDWVQERGLYFADKWDPKYKTVLSGNDPGENSLEGGLLYTNYGKGIFIYTGYSWFRQIPAGVPGAFRIFVNLISARQNEPD